MFDVEVVAPSAPTGVKHACAATAVDADRGADAARRRRRAAAGQGRLPAAVGTARGRRASKRCAAGVRVQHARTPFTLGGRGLSGRHGDRPRSRRIAPDVAATLARSRRGTAPRSCRSTARASRAASRSAAATSPALKAPRVLLAWDTPTSSLSAGWARYVLERRFGLPVTAVRAVVARTPRPATGTTCWCCRRATTGIQRRRGAPAEGLDARGGTLVTLAEASRWAARDERGPARHDDPNCAAASRTDARGDGAAATSRRSREPTPTQPIRLRQGDPARARAPRDAPARCCASSSISSTGSPPAPTARSGDRRGLARLHAAQARQGQQRRRLRQATRSSRAAWCGTRRSRSWRARRS